MWGLGRIDPTNARTPCNSRPSVLLGRCGFMHWWRFMSDGHVCLLCRRGPPLAQSPRLPRQPEPVDVPQPQLTAPGALALVQPGRQPPAGQRQPPRRRRWWWPQHHPHHQQPEVLPAGHRRQRQLQPQHQFQRRQRHGQRFRGPAQQAPAAESAAAAAVAAVASAGAPEAAVG